MKEWLLIYLLIISGLVFLWAFISGMALLIQINEPAFWVVTVLVIGALFTQAFYSLTHP